MYEMYALGNRSSLALCLTKVRSSRAHCPATALISSPEPLGSQGELIGWP